jgi:hypothetical protein
MKFGRKEENTKSFKVHIDADRNPLLHTPEKVQKDGKKNEKKNPYSNVRPIFIFVSVTIQSIG